MEQIQNSIVRITISWQILSNSNAYFFIGYDFNINIIMIIIISIAPRDFQTNIVLLSNMQSKHTLFTFIYLDFSKTEISLLDAIAMW